MRVKDGQLHFNTMVPNHWESFTFKILFRKRLLKLNISKNNVSIDLVSGEALQVMVNGEMLSVS